MQQAANNLRFSIVLADLTAWPPCHLLLSFLAFHSVETDETGRHLSTPMGSAQDEGLLSEANVENSPARPRGR